MAGRKFFSGLPDGMMGKNSQRPNRQQTNFYWPDESEVESNSFKTAARNRLRSRCTSSASLMSQSQASSDTEESRRRKLQQNDSKIEFFDYADATDTESVVSTRDRNRKKKIETLSSRIAFYDFVDPNESQNQNIDDDVQSVIERPQKVKKDAQKSENPQVNEQKIISNLENSVDIENLTKDIDNMEIKSSVKKAPYQYVDSFSDDSDDNSRYFRDNGSSSRMFDERRHLPPRYPSTQRFMQRRPRPREYYDYDDEIDHDRSYSYENPRRRSIHPQSNRGNRRYGGDYFSQELSDEEYYFQNPRQRQYGMPIQHGSYFEENGNHHTRHNSRMSLNRRASVNGLADMEKIQVEDIPKTKSIAKVEVERQSSTLSAERRSPAKTLKRTESVNEARQRYFTNLKSNIFHNNSEYSEIIEKKPLSVRDFAASQRVGVGLPDIDFC